MIILDSDIFTLVTYEHPNAVRHSIGRSLPLHFGSNYPSAAGWRGGVVMKHGMTRVDATKDAPARWNGT